LLQEGKKREQGEKSADLNSRREGGKKAVVRLFKALENWNRYFGEERSRKPIPF